MVLVERTSDKEQANYRVFGLPPGEDFRDEDSYDEYIASWLKLDGYGIACPGLEISQHGRSITIEQEHEGGSLHIKTEGYRGRE